MKIIANGTFDFLMEKPIEDKFNGMDRKILGVFGSAESLIISLGIVVSVVMLLICSAKMVAMNKKNKEEKSRLYRILGCMVFFFGSITIVGMVVIIAKTFSQTL